MPLLLALADGTALDLDPATLALRLTGPRLALTLAAPGEPAEVAGLEATPDAVRWRLPSLGLAVAVTRRPDGADIRFTPAGEPPEDFTWPRTATDPAAEALGVPLGGGLHLPLGEPFWRDQLAGEDAQASGGLTFPAWSVDAGPRSITWLLPDEPRTTLSFIAPGGRLAAEARHAFRRRDGGRPYEVRLGIGPRHPLAAAQAYRRWLVEAGRLVPFAAKAKASPDAARLLGATHAYLWGTGRSPTALSRLRALGVDRMWLGWDQDPRGDAHVVGPPLIRLARGWGWLAGPYLTLDNVQDPKTADTPQSVFDEALYRTGAVRTWEGKPRGGFAGRGHELSSEALRRAPRDWIGERLAGVRSAGANAPFLDCDAFGELHDDHDPAHPMTPWRDRENRLARMRRLGLEAGLVLGSETGVGWAVPALHFAHGAHAIPGTALWGLLGPKGKAVFGSWGPTDRPRIFFQEAAPDPSTARALYDPVARVPLYQAAFHDQIVTTDRWEFSPVKLRGQVRERLLLELLYLQPSVWSLDARAIAEHGPRLAAVHKFFAPLHRAFGVAALTDFRWLAPDRRVQQATYAGGLVLTANFDARPRAGLPGLAIAARWPDGRVTTFRPAP